MQNHSRKESSKLTPFKKLAEQYPLIYDKNFTFCVPDQWLNSLRRLSLAINTLLTQYPGVSIEVTDVKEKHGELRFYYSLAGPKSTQALLDRHIEVLIAKANQQIQRMISFGNFGS